MIEEANDTLIRRWNLFSGRVLSCQCNQRSLLSCGKVEACSASKIQVVSK